MPDPRFLAPPPGVFPPGWQYSLADPGAAVRNKLREMGMLGNVMNPYHMQAVDQMSTAVLPHYLSQVLGQQGVPGTSMEEGWGDFLEKYLRGEIKPLGFSGAQGAVDALRQNLAEVSKTISSDPRFTPNMTPEEVQQLANKLTLGEAGVAPKLSVPQAAIAGLSADPRRQMAMMTGAYQQALGPTLTTGLGKVLSPVAEAYQDYGGRMLGKTFLSLLDLLSGGQSPWAGSAPFGGGGGQAPDNLLPSPRGFFPPHQESELDDGVESMNPGGGGGFSQLAGMFGGTPRPSSYVEALMQYLGRLTHA